LLCSHGTQTVELVVSLRSTLQALGVATVLVQGGILALPLGDVLLHLSETIARHFG